MPDIPGLVRKGYSLLVRTGNALQSPFLLAVRVCWGWQFFQTGRGKLGDLEKVAGFFADLHIPLPKVNALLAGSTECFGGLLLLVGLASRLTALPLIFTMIVAYATAEREALNVLFSNPDKFFSAAPFLFLFAALIVLIFGPGAFSADHLLAKKFAAGRSGK